MLPGFDLASFAVTTGPWIVVLVIAIIIFAESGLLIGFFLPGDTLLFTAGFLVNIGKLNVDINLLVAIVFVAAVLGDGVGYLFGKRIGRNLFNRPNSRLLRQENLQKAEVFYKKYGSITIVIARFIPVIRTFAPIVAGVGKMNYRTFLSYNVIGALLWAAGIIYAGYFIGQMLHSIGIDIDTILLPIMTIIIIVSILSPALHALGSKKQRAALWSSTKKQINVLFKENVNLKTYMNASLPRFTAWRLTVSGLLLFVGIVSVYFIHISIKNHTGLAYIDQPTLEWITAHRTSVITVCMQIITNLMSPPMLVGITLIGASIWAWRKKEYWRPGLLVVTLGGSFAISTTIKVLTQRSRPPVINMISPLETSYSFPSNHTFGIAVCVLVLGYLLYSRRQSIGLLLTWAIVGITSIVLVSLSRIYLGYHWLTDVTASVCLALVILGLVVLIDAFQPVPSTKDL